MNKLSEQEAAAIPHADWPTPEPPVVDGYKFAQPFFGSAAIYTEATDK